MFLTRSTVLSVVLYILVFNILVQKNHGPPYRVVWPDLVMGLNACLAIAFFTGASFLIASQYRSIPAYLAVYFSVLNFIPILFFGMLGYWIVIPAFVVINLIPVLVLVLNHHLLMKKIDAREVCQ